MYCFWIAYYIRYNPLGCCRHALLSGSVAPSSQHRLNFENGDPYHLRPSHYSRAISPLFAIQPGMAPRQHQRGRESTLDGRVAHLRA